MATKKDVSYQELSSELELVLEALQQDDIDIDVALQKYERGLELVKQLEAYLKTAENKVSKLKAQTSGS